MLKSARKDMSATPGGENTDCSNGSTGDGGTTVPSKGGAPQRPAPFNL
ncbi:MAG: hypothetical protein ACI8RZ_006587 [Myxococcota bacterium]|jgi:hypothetical protein